MSENEVTNEVASEVTEKKPITKMPITLIETAIVVGKVIAGKEDFVYKKPLESHGSCVYSDRANNPSCIIGHVFDELGVERPRWSALENKSRFGSLPQSHLFTSAAYEFLRVLQGEQDNLATWGTAVKYAAEIVKGSCN